MKGSMTELYLIRHGETELNKKEVYHGWIDCGLSENGVMQAEDLADILQNVSFDAVISSSLKRAVETSVIVSGYTPDKITKDHRLRELSFGDWEGLCYREIKERYKAEWESFSVNWKSSSPPRGESFFEMYTRVKNCIEDILKVHSGERVLIVSHHGTMRIIPVILLGLKEEAYWSFTAEQGRYSHYIIDEKGLCIIKRLNSRG